MYDKEVRKILNKLAIFDKMYEVIRFVDPVYKKVITYNNNNINELADNCFDFWEKNKICDNCVSIRAFNEGKTFVKIEYNPEKVYMVTAIPLELEERRVVIELLKDTTSSMIIANDNHDKNTEIYSMIDGMNNIALKDPLTGLYNRRYINEKLPVDLVNCALLDQELSIIIADIDFFKKVNDTYGHLAGDEVLKGFAGILSGCLEGEGNWVSRFGGEGFLICLPGAEVSKAVEIAEKMRRAVESKEIKHNDTIIRITSSFGVYSVIPEHGSKIDDFIEAADKKLYLAKNNGRNRVEY